MHLVLVVEQSFGFCRFDLCVRACSNTVVKGFVHCCLRCLKTNSPSTLSENKSEPFVACFKCVQLSLLLCAVKVFFNSLFVCCCFFFAWIYFIILFGSGASVFPPGGLSFFWKHLNATVTCMVTGAVLRLIELGVGSELLISCALWKHIVQRGLMIPGSSECFGTFLIAGN